MEKPNKITQEELMNLLDDLYKKIINGFESVNPKLQIISPPISVIADNYLKKQPNPEEAAKSMIKNQIIKCTTSGFITGFGGIVTLPITIPANIGSVLYVQMRMIACTAYMAGYDLHSDHAQTLVYACLAGVSLNEVLKKFSVKLGEKVANNLIKRIPGEVLIKINQRVGFRLLTKFGEKGIINLWKLVPVVGAGVNGTLDLIETKFIGNRAYKWFFANDFTLNTNEEPIEEIIIENK